MKVSIFEPIEEPENIKEDFLTDTDAGDEQPEPNIVPEIFDWLWMGSTCHEEMNRFYMVVYPVISEWQFFYP